MGWKNKKLQIFLIILFLLILICTTAAFIRIMVKERRHTFNISNAIELYEKGKYAEAQMLFLRILSSDPNQEQAYVHLAKIARHNGDWHQEYLFWAAARRLNTLNEDYPKFIKKALALARDYPKLKVQCFQVAPDIETLSDEDIFLFILTKVHTEKWDIHTRHIDYLQLHKPQFFDSDYGKLLLLLLTDDLSAEQVKILETFSKSSNSLIAYEALISLLKVRSQGQNQTKSVEDTLLEMAKCNPFCGNELLIHYYYRSIQFDKAIAIALSDWRKFKRLTTVLSLAELYLLNGQGDKIEELHKQINGDTRLQIRVRHHLNALKALSASDAKSLIKGWEGAENIYLSPLSRYCQLYYYIEKNDLANVRLTWRMLHDAPPFYDLNRRAQKILLKYIQFLIKENRVDSAVSLLLLPEAPLFKDVISTRAYILSRFRNRSLTEGDLNKAIKAFPQDLVILQCMVEFLYYTEKFQESLKYINSALNYPLANNSGIYYFKIQNLIKLHRIDEASNYFYQRVINIQDDSLLLAYCKFCVLNKRVTDLQKLVKDMEKLPKTNLRYQLIPYVQGEIYFLNNEIKLGLDQFEKTQTDNPAILFRIGEKLSEFDRHESGIPIYQKLLANPKAAIYHNFAMANLSELFWLIKDKEQGFKFALQAWKAEPGNLEFQYCYAHKLLAENRSDEVLRVLSKPSYEVEVPQRIIDLWVKAATLEIPRLFKNGEMELAETYCRLLLVYQRVSPLADEYLDKIDKFIRGVNEDTQEN